MLKIKDNKNIDEVQDMFLKHKGNGNNFRIQVDKTTRIIEVLHYQDFSLKEYLNNDYTYRVEPLPIIIYDLIQAGLVEKIEE